MKRNIERPRRDRELRTDDVAKPANENIVFGVMPVLEALRSKSGRVERLSIAVGSNPHRLREIFDLAHSAGLRIDRLSSEQLDRITGRDVNHQGVVAFVAAADYADPDAIFASLSNDTLLLLLDGVEDPRNLGAILRTAECAGVGGVFIPERRAVGLTETVAKSAAGATEHIKVAKVSNLNKLIEDLKKQNVWVVGASADARIDHTEWDWTRASALVLGGEGKGLHRLVAENCDVLVKIPMYGKIDSLNVSVAAGVILFEARRQRGKLKTENGK
ncbi:MAG: 23S rRNA (guanosine(2251)-2'-O)-methyltransferase RlmB [Acidobacteria bacterium]|nr:MAG: 23S rRNA (guanosine(2251)-2'-O)-methyltransferase RlmB [Acidobacteriota bacterium]